MRVCVCVFQSEVLGVLEEETWGSFQQRQLNFNQVGANILWISPLNKFSSSQDELSLKAFCKSGRFQHFPRKSNCWDSRIPGLQVVHRNPGFQLPPMERRSGTTCRSALCCPFAFGSTRGEESRKVGCWWLLSLDTNHLGFFSFKLNAWEPENDSFQVRNLHFFRVRFRWNHGKNFRGVLLMVPKSGKLNQLRLVVLSHYLQGFIYARWCRISSINSISIFQYFRYIF